MQPSQRPDGHYAVSSSLVRDQPFGISFDAGAPGAGFSIEVAQYQPPPLDYLTESVGTIFATAGSSYTWQYATARYLLTGSQPDVRFALWLCPAPGTATPTGTTSPTPTFVSTATPGGAILPTAACLPLASPTLPIAYSMPDLSLELPTLKALPTSATTATTTLSTTAIVAFFGTIEAGIATPGSGIATAVASYSWQSGANLSATSVAAANPALAWFAILNPSAPAWTTSGGPLWALSPILMPIMPIFIVLFGVLLVRFLLFVVGWLLKLFDVIIKLIELIPGE